MLRFILVNSLRFYYTKHRFNELSSDRFVQMMKWNRIGISNVAGEVALLSGLVMWITSSSPVRRKLFELFLYTHHLYIVFVFFYVLHVGFAYSCIMLPGFYLFLVDRFLRFLQSQQKIRVVSARVLPCQAMELTFSKDPSKFKISVPNICSLLNSNLSHTPILLRTELQSSKHHVHQCEEHIYITVASIHCNIEREHGSRPPQHCHQK